MPHGHDNSFSQDGLIVYDCGQNTDGIDRARKFLSTKFRPNKLSKEDKKDFADASEFDRNNFAVLTNPSFLEEPVLTGSRPVAN